jgi:palmitoyl-protein thioesterase
MKIILCLLIITKYILAKTYPIAIFHGIGDSCKFDGLTQLVHYLRMKLNVDVECIEVGNGFITSWFMNFTTQAEEACEKIKTDRKFQKKFSIFGISQGALIGRYIIEKCKMKGEVAKYLSIDSPQMGIGVLPKIVCGMVCDWINSLFYKVVYSEYLQANIGASGFFKNPYDMDSYLIYSSFLADLNNEGHAKNETYKENFKKLEKAMFVKNSNDTVIIPKETAWFEFFEPGSVDKVIPLQESDFYRNDYIGLRYLVENNRTQFIEWDGDHVSFTLSDVQKYLLDFFV